MTREELPTERLVRDDPARMARLRERIERARVTEVLRPLIGELPESLLDEIERVALRGGEILFREGDPSDQLYIVVDGRLQREIGPPAGRGEVLGVSGVLRDEGYRTTVTALRDSQLVRVSRAQLRAWSERFPRFGLALARQLVDRLEMGDRPARPSCRVVAVVPHRDMEPVRHLCGALPDALHRETRGLVLDAEGFEARFDRIIPAHPSPHGPHHGVVAGALGDLEGQYDLLVLVTDPAPTEWTRRCLRQADGVLVVASAEDDHRPGPLEAVAATEAPGRPVELVLLHPETTPTPSGTARWLAPDNRFERHHHLRRGERGHLLSLARRLTGRAVGLVLGGGGARGFAHLGVWRALQEGGIHVDHFGGTSMGALLAAAFAMDVSFEEGMAHASRFTDPGRLFDFTLPVTSLFRSAKLRRFVREFYGDQQIEDLWTPFFCVACNLSTAERTILKRGPLHAAVRASISIPGVFAPVIVDGEIVVDGGVMDNFPVDRMRHEARSDRILAVNVAPPVLSRKRFDMVDHVSGWWVLARRLSPFTRSVRVPSIVATVMRSLEVNSARSSLDQRTRAHLLLEPNVRSVGILDFHRYQEAARIGYETARTKVPAWAGENAPTVFLGDLRR